MATMDDDIRAALRETPEGVEVDVWAVPGAVQTGLRGLYGAALRLRVAAPAEEGKANRAICALLTELTGAPVELTRGARSRRKQFLVRGTNAKSVARVLAGSPP